MPRSKKVFVYYEYKKKTKLPEGVLLSGRCSPNYYHWLIEYLARLYTLQSLKGLRNVPLIIDARTYPQEFESLKIIFPNAQIHLYEPGEYLDVDVLHIPSIPTYLPDTLKIPLWKGAALSYDSLKYLRNSVFSRLNLPVTRSAEKGRHIYLTRRSGRMIANNADVEQLLTRLGFEIVDTGELTFREQVEMFADAKMIVGPLGAAFANLIFASAECKVLGLTSPFAVMFPLQASLARFAGCRFKILGGIQNGYQAGDEDRCEDLALNDFMGIFEVDLVKLEDAVRRF